jgi:surface antigen
MDVMRKFKLLGGFAFLMMFSIASSQANAQDWGGVVGGLAGGMIAYTPHHRTVYAAAPRRQYTHTVTTAAQPSGPSGDDLRGILGSHN